MRCSRCNAEIPENYGYCPLCGTAVAGREKKASIGLAVLSFFVPLVGLILYIVKKDSEPKTAKLSGKCALVSVILQIVLSVVLSLAVFGLAFFALDNDALMDDMSGPVIQDSIDEHEEEEYLVTSDGRTYVSGQIIVCFKDKITDEKILDYIWSLGGTVIRSNDLMKVYVVEFDIDDYDGLVKKLYEIKESNLIAFAELNEVIEFEGNSYTSDTLV